MTPEEKIEELYERIFELKDKLLVYENVTEFVKKMILNSSITIQDCMEIMNVLNYPEEKTCSSGSYFLPKEYTNKKLKEVLEMI